KIYVPGAVNTTKTVVLRYKVLNALRFFPDHDELYWNVTGNEWEMAIENATARIELPASVTGLHAEAFTGGYGQRGQEAEVKVEGNVIQIRMQRPLFFHEGLTAVVFERTRPAAKSDYRAIRAARRLEPRRDGDAGGQ